MKVQFGPPAPLTSDSPRYCPPRGLAVPGLPHYASRIAADVETPQVQVLAVAAHELGHQVASVRFAGRPADGLLNEGVATLWAQEYVIAWLGWPSLDEVVRTFVIEGTYIPFDQRGDLVPWAGLTADECWARRDTLYGQYGSFVGFLSQEYGMEAVGRLWASMPPPPGPPLGPPSPDYEGVYGKSLEALEREWLGRLGTQDE